MERSLLKDVVSRYQIRNKRALDQLMTHYLTNVSSLHSYTALRKAYGINEVDLVVPEHYRPKAAMQVVFGGLAQPKTRARELSALLECLHSLKLKEGTVITFDHEERLEMDGRRIDCIPASQWLASR